MTADLVLGMLLAGAALASQSPDKQLQSKDPLVRIRAIETLRSAATEADVKRLTQALRDRDWEVREKAAEILGTTGSKQALEPLVKLCLKGEVARMRYAAALALAEIDAAAAAKLLSKKLSAKKTARNACEALMVLYARGGSGNPSKRIRRLLSSDDTREAACLAQFAAQTKRGDPLRKILASDLAVGAAALDMMRRMPRAGDLAALAPLMNGKRLHEVLERRLRHALRAALSAEPEPGKAAARLLDSLEENAVTRTRQARLLPLLVRARILGKAAASGRLAPCLESRDAGARAAAAKGLREVGGEAAWKLALARFDQEDSARVRFQLMETIVRLRGLSQPPWVSWLAERLGDEDPKVRERAAVLLGRRGLDGAHPALVAALRDPDWTVAVCAAVSLGKSFEDEAVAPLVDLARHADWKLRGAAIVGLMHLNREAVVETLIGAVADPVPMVARAAHEGLRRISSRNDIQRKRSAWRAWWKAERKRLVFEDWQEIEENRKKYGYAVPDRDIYAGLDIVVLLSRGDHIEKLLDRLEIGYRETQASKVLEAGLHPEA
ncbi:MAG: HEAT repeat domain-containing protein, partial [Planctomycetota bacterium]